MKKDYYADLLPNCCYHIYNKSIDGLKLFHNRENYEFFLKRYNDYLGSYMATYSFALIPNHFHFLAKCKPLSEEILKKIAKENTKKSYAFLQGEIDYNTFMVSQFKRFFNSYAVILNKQEKRQGSLFQHKFKRIGIKKREHFLYMLWYQHHNGIHHKMVKEYAHWPHSSYLAYLDDRYSILTKDTVLKLFVNENGRTLREEFVRFHEDNKGDLGLYPKVHKWKDSSFDFMG